ncbi:MAG: T9SS type A sorting domain-containing protein [Fidelibacterota bacterium]|nr:MAG: T9SS type A sorting domain-containing protein [Candidatus Neomarinimicrobiota bacterium]
MRIHISSIAVRSVCKILSSSVGLTLLCTAILVADPVKGEEIPEKYSKVKILINTEDDIRTAKSADLELGRVHYFDGYLESILDTREMEALDKTSLSFEIIIDDVAAYYHEYVRIPDAELESLEMEMKAIYDISGFEFGSMGGYYTFDEVIMELDSMRLLYPDLISTKQSIGLSIDGLDIWAVKISDNPDNDEDEPEVLYTALHHAREPQSMATAVYFMYYLLENYGINPFVTFIVDNRELYFVPVLNPDGYVYNEQTNPNGGGMLRKNKRDNNANGVFEESFDGVNLCRNYGYQWGYDDLGSSPNPSSGNYRGAGPFSEPETQAIRDFCIARNFQLALNYHTPWRHLFVPWGYIYDDLTPDSTTFTSLAENITRYNQYSWSASTRSGSIAGVVNGYSDDWMYGEQALKNKIFAMTLEVGISNDSFIYWPPQDQIYPLAQENVYSSLILAFGPGVIDTSMIHVQNARINAHYLVPGLDTLFMTVEIVNPNSDSVAVQAIIESMDHSSSDAIPMLDDGNHRDNKASDGIYGMDWPVPIDEKDYTLQVYLRSEDLGIDSISNDVTFFTTIGPVVYDSFTFAEQDTIPNPGNYFPIKVTLRNMGSVTAADSIRADLSTSDTNVTSISLVDPIYGNIPPDGTATTVGSYWIRLSDNCPAPLDIPFELSISSEGYTFWSSSFSIHVYEPDVAIADESALPREFAIHPAYPNPFNPVTTLRYDLPQRAEVDLTIYDILGRQVMTLVQSEQAPGYKTVTWDGTDDRGQPVSSGVYLYRIMAGEFTQSSKMVLLR